MFLPLFHLLSHYAIVCCIIQLFIVTTSVSVFGHLHSVLCSLFAASSYPHIHPSLNNTFVQLGNENIKDSPEHPDNTIRYQYATRQDRAKHHLASPNTFSSVIDYPSKKGPLPLLLFSFPLRRIAFYTPKNLTRMIPTADPILSLNPEALPPSALHMLSLSPKAMEKMSGISNPLMSPNAIPPRTSSTGIPTSLNATPTKPVLRPVPEGDWLSQKQLSPKAQMSNAGYGVMQAPNPPPDPERYAHEDLEFTAKRSWTDEKENVVRGPYDYVISHPGKDFRAQLIGAFNAWLDVPTPSLEVITRVVGMLHESSLLIDDVQDSSELRRGFPVAHNIFGVAQTINSANYIYFVALQELHKLNNPELITIFSDELVNLHRGQGMDLFWRDTLTCPTEEDYLEMVGNKTGGLFRLGIKLMAAEANGPSPTDCVPLVNLIGLIFQIRDDYMNLSSKEYSHNKGMCEDLTEGKFSFPVIHSIRSNPTNLQLINILKQKTSDTQVKRYAVAYMESTGSFEYTRKVLNVLIERARKMAEELDQGRGSTKGIQKILDKMAIQ